MKPSTKKGMLLACAGLALLAITGCATRGEIKQFQDDLMVLRLRLDGLLSENRRMMALLEDVNANLGRVQEENARAKADLLAEMGSLREQSQILQGLLDDTGDRMSRLIHRVEDRAAVPVAMPAASDSVTTGAIPADTTKALPSMETLDPKHLYNAAYLDLSQGEHDLARRGFEEYLRLFPASEYADNAQYWLGEIDYAAGDYARAYQSFERVTQAYPRGDKMAAARLKMGYCLIQQDQKAEARTCLNRVIQEHPGSAEARLAKARLEEL